MRERLFTPGPVEIPDRVLEALGGRPPHHRTEAFRALMAGASARLAGLFGTRGQAVVLAASGTGGMEAAMASLLGRGERALVATAGKFGDRWLRVLEAYGHAPAAVRAEWGRALDPGELDAACARERPGIVFLTHSETSTGTLHDLPALAAAARAYGALVVADTVTSFGVHRLLQDEDGIDVAVTGSQKGLMLPPGLTVVSLGPRALERLAAGIAAGPAFYFDLRKAAAQAATGDTPFTPAISLVVGLAAALDMIEEIGIESVWRRHAALARAVRAGAVAAGFALFSARPADSVTALLPPAGAAAAAVVQRVRAARGFVLAGGQDQLKGRIVRAALMGLAYGPDDAVEVSDALEEAALAAGAAGTRGRARAAALASLAEFPCGSAAPAR